MRGAVRLGFAVRRGASRLTDLYQAGSAKAMLPRTMAPHPEATLINTAGGLTGGDRLDWDVTLADGAAATLATQTAERIYRAADGQAEVTARLSLGAGARLDWLAQETILFERAALSRRIEADLAPDARLLLVEPLVLGRAAMGEDPDTLRLADRWRIRRGGRLLHAEALTLAPPLSGHRAGPAGLGAMRALATVLYVGADAEDRLAPARAAWPGGVLGGVSAWDGRLVARLAAPRAADLRAALTAFLTRFRGAPLPRVWTM